ncbi:hypothetical protein ACVR1G_08280 [Streptococcus dentasini]
MDSLKKVRNRLNESPFLQTVLWPFTWYKRNKVRRKLVNVLVLLSVISYLVVGSYFSPNKQKYSDAQLATEQTFQNNSGSIKMTSQTYDKKKGAIVLQFETSDKTTDVDLGIASDNLSWKMYAKNPSEAMQMEVVPIIDNKISVIITGVPKNFEAIAIDITNHSVDTSEINVDLSDSSSSSSFASNQSQKSSSNDNIVEFYVTTQGPKLKPKSIAETSREAFTLSELDKEVTFQKGQLKSLNRSIDQLNKVISDDGSKIEHLNKDAKYLTGQDLEDNQSNVEKIQDDIDSKNTTIEEANTNIETIQAKLKSLAAKKEAVKNGTFEFASPVQSVHLNK